MNPHDDVQLWTGELSAFHEFLITIKINFFSSTVQAAWDDFGVSTRKAPQSIVVSGRLT
jgi:hypothetical protein